MKWMTSFALFGVVLCSAAVAANGDDQQAIEQLMTHTWDQPDVRLKVGPVTVVVDHAVAGWTQGERGGRALLRRDGGAWKVVLCAGDELLETASLRDAGLSAEQAVVMSQSVRTAEAALPAARVKQFALFKGQVQVNPHQGHEPMKH